MADKDSEAKAKASVERQNKINSVYRDLQEIEKLEEELDSAKAKYDTPEKSAAYKKEVNAKISKAKSKLKSNSDAIIKSGDKELVKEFKSELGKDKNLSNAVNYKSNTKTMPTKKKDRDYTKVIGDYADKKAELDYLKKTGRIDEYKEKKADLDKKVAFAIHDKQKIKEAELESSIAEAEKNKDWTKASQLSDEKKKFDDNKVDFSNMKRTKGAIEKGGSVSGEPGKNELDLDYDKIYKNFESNLAEEQKQEEENNLAPQPNSPEETYSGGGGQQQEETVPTNVDDRNQDGGAGGTESTGEKRDWAGDKDKAQQDLNDYNSFSQEKFQHDYAPDNKQEGDLFGTLMDAGQGVLGFMGANEEVPEYSKGSMFSEAMDDASRMKDQGLSSTEKDYRKNMAETGYAYDIKNMRRAVGGNAGAFLGNAGRAQSQLQDQYAQIAGADESARRGNRENFQNMAMKDETVNRQIFEDDLRQTEMTKQAGSGMIQDALRNIQDRKDFSNQYGKGSIYYEHMKTLDKDKQESMFNRENANERRVTEGRRELENNLAEANKAYEDNNTLDGVNNPIIATQEAERQEANNASVAAEEKPVENPLNILDQYEAEDITTETDDEGNVMKKASSDLDTSTDAEKEDAVTNKKIAKKGVDKKARANEIAKLMEATDDMEELDKLDKELSSLKL